MSLTHRLENWLQSAVKAYGRFPLTVAFSILSFLILSCLILFKIVQNSEFLFICLAWCSSLGISASFAVHLFLESRPASKALKFKSYCGLFALLIGLFFYIYIEQTKSSMIFLYLWILIVHLAASFAPFAGRKVTDKEVWFFNFHIFVRILVSLFFANVLWFGVLFGILLVTFLFKIDFSHKIYLIVWLFCCFIFQTLFFLAGTPRIERSEDQDQIPKHLRFFSGSLLVPLFSAYALIVLSYFVKLLFDSQWPHGYTAWLISTISTFGVLIYLVSFPLFNEAKGLLRLFGRHLFLFLPVLLFLLPIAAFMRISQYGFTEERYYLVVSFFWLLGISIYFSFKKNRSILAIPISLAIIVAVSSLGPWGFSSVTQMSQRARLSALLEQTGLLKNGILQKAESSIKPADEKEIGQILVYLVDHFGPHSIQSYFETPLPTMSFDPKEVSYPFLDRYYQGSKEVDYVDKLLKNLNLKYIDQWNASSRYFYLSARDQDLNRYQRISGQIYQFWMGQPGDVFIKEANLKLKVDLANKQFLITDESKAMQSDKNKSGSSDVKCPTLATFNFAEPVLKLVTRYGNLGVPAEEMSFEIDHEKFHLKVFVTSVSGDQKGSEVADIRLTGFQANGILELK